MAVANLKLVLKRFAFQSEKIFVSATWQKRKKENIKSSSPFVTSLDRRRSSGVNLEDPRLQKKGYSFSTRDSPPRQHRDTVVYYSERTNAWTTTTTNHVSQCQTSPSLQYTENVYAIGVSLLCLQPRLCAAHNGCFYGPRRRDLLRNHSLTHTQGEKENPGRLPDVGVKHLFRKINDILLFLLLRIFFR